MRAVGVILGGIVMSAAAYFLSGLLTGLPGAIAFMLSPLIGAVALGIAAAQGHAAWEDRRTPPRRVSSLRKRTCRDCASRKIVRADVVLCPACDMVMPSLSFDVGRGARRFDL